MEEPRIETTLQKIRDGEDTPYETIRIDSTGRATVISRDDGVERPWDGPEVGA